MAVESLYPQAEEEAIVLFDDEGNAVYFDFLDTVERENTNYIVLLPRDGDGETVTIMEMREDPAEEDSYTFHPVESQKLLQSIFRSFRSKNQLDEI